MKYEELKDEIKAAMKAHDNVRRDILRQVHTELKAIEVNERREVTEADVDAMLKRTIKQTKETLDGSIKAGNNQERTDTLTEQVAILEEYLPRQVEGDELAALIDEVLADIVRRDELDSARETSPLVAAADAKCIDSTGFTIDEIIEQICAMARAAGANA